MASPSSPVDAPLSYENSEFTVQMLLLLVGPACGFIVVILMIPFILLMFLLWKFRKLIRIRMAGSTLRSLYAKPERRISRGFTTLQRPLLQQTLIQQERKTEEFQERFPLEENQSRQSLCGQSPSSIHFDPAEGDMDGQYSAKCTAFINLATSDGTDHEYEVKEPTKSGCNQSSVSISLQHEAKSSLHMDLSNQDLYVNPERPNDPKLLAEGSKSRGHLECAPDRNLLSSKVSESIYDDIPSDGIVQGKCEDFTHTSTVVLGFLPDSKTTPSIRFSQVQSIYDLPETGLGSAYVNLPSPTIDKHQPDELQCHPSEITNTGSKQGKQSDSRLLAEGRKTTGHPERSPDHSSMSLKISETLYDDIPSDVIFQSKCEDTTYTHTDVGGLPPDSKSRPEIRLSHVESIYDHPETEPHVGTGSAYVNLPSPTTDQLLTITGREHGHPKTNPDHNSLTSKISETIYDDDIPNYIVFQRECEDSSQTSTNVVPDSKTGPSIHVSHVECIYDHPETDTGSAYVNLASSNVDKHHTNELQRRHAEVTISESKHANGAAANTNVPITNLSSVESMYDTSFNKAIYENQDSASTKPCEDDKQHLYKNIAFYENLPSEGSDQLHVTKCTHETKPSSEQSLNKNSAFYENIPSERKSHSTIVEDVYDDVPGQGDNIYEFEKCQYPITVQQRPHRDSTEPGFNFPPESRHEVSKSIKTHEVAARFQHDSVKGKVCGEDVYVYQDRK